MEVEHPPPPHPAESAPPTPHQMPNALSATPDSDALNCSKDSNPLPVPMEQDSVRSSSKSFRDTLVDGSAQSLPSLITLQELQAANEGYPTAPMSVDQEQSPANLVPAPRIRITKDIMQKLQTPWRSSIIIKLLGKSLNFRTLNARLRRDWKTEQEYDIIDLGKGFYVVKFRSMEDCNAILVGGPYKLFGHYLAVQPWEPNFQPSTASRPKTAVWVRFAELPLDYFQEPMFIHLANQIGRLIKIDSASVFAARGQFARVCVEMDLNKPLPVSVTLDFEGDLPPVIVKCVYEGLHTICFNCGEYGHKSKNCTHCITPNQNPQQQQASHNPNIAKLQQEASSFGPWMMATPRRPRRNTPSGNSNRNGDGANRNSDFPVTESQDGATPIGTAGNGPQDAVAPKTQPPPTRPDFSSNQFAALADSDETMTAPPPSTLPEEVEMSDASLPQTRNSELNPAALKASTPKPIIMDKPKFTKPKQTLNGPNPKKQKFPPKPMTPPPSPASPDSFTVPHTLNSSASVANSGARLPSLDASPVSVSVSQDPGPDLQPQLLAIPESSPGTSVIHQGQNPQSLSQ